MWEQALFKGIAVVIDDELDDPTSSIVKITQEIESDGGYTVGLRELPKPEVDLENFAGAAFFIMDWQLHGAVLGDAPELQGVGMPPHLKKQQLAEKIDFLKRLGEHRHAPVFIFTADATSDVKAALAEHPDLYVADEPSHIFVMSKSDVQKQGVFQVLNDWVNRTPSALVLRTWEQEYQRAKNDMFADFYSKSIYWPMLLWQTFAEDSVPPADELGRLIGRVLASRMAPFQVELNQFVAEVEASKQADEQGYRKKLMAVLEGERFVRTAGLHADSIAPGDVFKRQGYYWLNVRPDCDCIPRNGDTDVALYLLRGKKARPKDIDINPKYGTLAERDSQAAVYGMYEGETVIFDLKELHQAKWSECKDARIGRLLPPFITRIQQRYAAYMQRPGLPRVPTALVPNTPDPTASATAEVQTSPTEAMPATYE